MSTINYFSVKLLWMSIPNEVIGTDYGGTLENYPYVYVEIYNEGFISTITTMMSNNPNSAIAIFKIPTDRYLYDIPTSFYTLKGDDYAPIILFRPDQSLRFRVRLPNGQILQDATLDQTSPSPSNPLLQVNVVFEITPSERS